MATGAILVKTCALGRYRISNALALRHFAPSGLTILCAITPSCPCLNHYVEHVCAAVRVCGIDDTPHSFPLLPPPSLLSPYATSLPSSLSRSPFPPSLLPSLLPSPPLPTSDFLQSRMLWIWSVNQLSEILGLTQALSTSGQGTMSRQLLIEHIQKHSNL